MFCKYDLLFSFFLQKSLYLLCNIFSVLHGVGKCFYHERRDRRFGSRWVRVTTSLPSIVSKEAVLKQKVTRLHHALCLRTAGEGFWKLKARWKSNSAKRIWWRRCEELMASMLSWQKSWVSDDITNTCTTFHHADVHTSLLSQVCRPDAVSTILSLSISSFHLKRLHFGRILLPGCFWTECMIKIGPFSRLNPAPG